MVSILHPTGSRYFSVIISLPVIHYALLPRHISTSLGLPLINNILKIILGVKSILIRFQPMLWVTLAMKTVLTGRMA